MIRRVSLLARLGRFPGLWRWAYDLTRRHNGRLVSAWSAWRTALKLCGAAWQ